MLSRQPRRGRFAVTVQRSQEVAVIKALTLALFVGLAATTASFAGTSAIPTKKAGQLTVGFDVPAPGFWNGRVSGTTIKNPTGFEAGLASAIAKQLGLAKVVYVRAPFGGLFSPAPKHY